VPGLVITVPPAAKLPCASSVIGLLPEIFVFDEVQDDKSKAIHMQKAIALKRFQFGFSLFIDIS
jgi:hypothetical protein